MGKSLTLIRQAKTKLEYLHVDGTRKEITDRCLIYPDPDNKGWYLAISEKTSQAGMGKSRETAYSSLMISIARLIGYCFKESTQDSILLKSEDPRFKPEIRTHVTKIGKSEQNQWLRKLHVKLKESGEFREIGAKSKDTHHGLPAIRVTVKDVA